MSKYDQCEHRLHCGTCVKTGKLCPHLPQIDKEDKCDPYEILPLPKVDWVKDQVFNIPDCCVNCPNHPVNGGSGICNCALPYMSTTNILQSGNSYSIINNGDGTYTVDNSQRNDTVTLPYKDSQTEYDPKVPHTYTDSNGI